MNKPILLVLMLSAVSIYAASDDDKIRYLQHLKNMPISAEDAPNYFALTNGGFAFYRPPVIRDDYARMATVTDDQLQQFLATSDTYQVVGFVENTNTIKAIRQDLRIIKGNVATNKAQMRATVALTNGFSQAELRSLVNDLRRELIDTISEQQAQDKALLDMLKAQ